MGKALRVRDHYALWIQTEIELRISFLIGLGIATG